MRQAAIFGLMVIKRTIENHPPNAFDFFKPTFGRNIAAKADASRIIQIRKRRVGDFRFLADSFIERRP